MPKRLPVVAYLLLLVGIIAMLSPFSQREKGELDKLSGIKLAQASTSVEELSTLSHVQTEIKRAQDIHQLWLDFLVANPQWLKDNEAITKATPTLYDPAWHRYWVKIYSDTLYYLQGKK